MHQHAGAGHIIGMVICNLEVIDLNRILQQFMLYLLNDHVLAVDQDQDVPGAEMNCVRPAFYRRIKRVVGCVSMPPDGLRYNF